MLIYAASVKVPAIGLIYDPKIKSFMNYVGQGSTIDLNNIDEEMAREYIDDIVQNRDKKIERMNKVVDELKILSQKNSEIAIKLINE